MVARKLKPVEAGDGSYGGKVLEAWDRMDESLFASPDPKESTMATEGYAPQFTHKVIRDCGYGRVWSRLARDEQDAERIRDEWLREGRTDNFFNAGEFLIVPVREIALDNGGFYYEPIRAALSRATSPA